ncbi:MULTISPECIES: hypothetical protein [unclassified Bradyrhizobium]|uniref:hypothetical protein n=1 Tax=unclassified Bradyrhizobium TaxID=2631580 RepID=UPI0028E3C2A4|nr:MULTISPECIES: hypothetical protein [unclassified Bradyrhizobium]
MTRFVVVVCIAFVTTFVGVSWAIRGFPMRAPAPQLAAQVPALVDTTFGDDHAKEFERKAWIAEHTSQSDKNPKLDALRLDALQAATAYKMSPCDKTMKKNLVDAVTAYTRAYIAKLDCPRPGGLMMFCSDKTIRDAADTFSTPLDKRVQDAFNEAFEQKGVVKVDFPEDVRFEMLQFTGPSFWGDDESPICLPRQLHTGRDAR